jgi:hypothetical protein
MSSSYEEIANLIATYAFVTDDGDFTALGRLFRHGSLTLNGGQPVRGEASVTDLARQVLHTYEDGTLKTRHVTTNLFIDVDEKAGTARSRSYFTVFQSLPDLPLQPIAAGRYRDLFTCADGAWRFTERTVSTDFTGDVSHHVRLATH